MENFLMSNQVPGNLRHKSRNTPEIFGIGVDANSSHPIGLACNSTNFNARTNSNVASLVLEQQQQTAPNISAQHRRKRRRLEDAFQSLSLRQQQQYGAGTPDCNNRDTVKDTYRGHRVTERSNISDNRNVTRTPINNNGTIFPRSEKITTTVTPMTISKKLFSDATDSDVDLHKYGSEDVGFSLRSNLSFVSDDFKDISGRSRNEPTKFDFQMEGDDYIKSCSSVSSSTCSTSTPDRNVSSPNDTLFAPRKSKIRSGFGSSVTGPTTITDPVDARIEELIRHTRIQAMVKASIMMDKEKNKETSSARRKYPEGFLRSVKAKEDEIQQMDSEISYGKEVGGLRRKNDVDKMECGWECTKNVAMGTKDDINLKPRADYNTLNSMCLDGDGMNNAITVKGHKLTKRAAQKRGRAKQTQNNYTGAGNEKCTGGFVAWQRRSKSLPKQT